MQTEPIPAPEKRTASPKPTLSDSTSRTVTKVPRWLNDRPKPGMNKIKMIAIVCLIRRDVLTQKK